MQTQTDKITLTKLIDSSNIPSKLIRSVVNQIGGWESFTESAPDIANHGIDGGFSGFIYYSDTEPFARRNRALIAEMASDQANDFGTNPIELIAGFNCFCRNRKSRNRDEFMPVDQRTSLERQEDNALREQIAKALYTGKQDDDGENVLNALAWYAGEEVARAYNDMLENN